MYYGILRRLLFGCVHVLLKCLDYGTKAKQGLDISKVNFSLMHCAALLAFVVTLFVLAYYVRLHPSCLLYHFYS
jgi:hypothetical protein